MCELPLVCYAITQLVIPETETYSPPNKQHYQLHNNLVPLFSDQLTMGTFSTWLIIRVIQEIILRVRVLTKRERQSARRRAGSDLTAEVTSRGGSRRTYSMIRNLNIFFMHLIYLYVKI